MKKITFKLFIIVLFVIFINSCTYADDIISEEYFPIENFSIETNSNISEEPNINARHAVVFDRHSKLTIYNKKENEKCKMASTTKIMTAIIVIENSGLDSIVTISKKSASTGGSRVGLSKNDKITVEHLLYGLLLKSGNDAAVALAEHTGGSVENFSKMMNNKAKELNLLNTNFVTPHGLDNDNHYTSALDLAYLSNYALENKIFAKIVNTKKYTIYINNTPKNIVNTNELLGNFNGIYGIKTGFTNGANRCLVTSCRRGDLDFICVVLGCDTKKDRTNDSIKLLDYAFNNFSLLNTYNIMITEFNKWKLSHNNSFFVNKGKNQNLNLYLDENNIEFKDVAIKNSLKDKINVEISFCSNFEAPLKPNTKIGNLILSIDSKKYYSLDILNKTEISKRNIYDYIYFIFKDYCKFFEQNSSILL